MNYINNDPYFRGAYKNFVDKMAKNFEKMLKDRLKEGIEMSRLNKYMVYNPKADKPKVYYSDYNEALKDAEAVSSKEHQDVLVLKVVAKVETKTTQTISEVIKELR